MELSRHLSRLFFATGFTVATWACSGQIAPQPLPEVSGGRLVVPIGQSNVVSAVPPKGCKIIDDQTWLWPLGQDRGIVMRVHRSETPPGGTKPYVDSLIGALGKTGQAGLERDEQLRLGDLDARAVEATELRNKPAMALWLVIAEAEDGLYTATAYGERDDLRRKSSEIRGFLSSLRVEARDGAVRIPIATTPTDPLDNLP